MKHRITYIDAMEILDSRGNPTLEVEVVLGSGVRATASVPSGASTGALEAVELRDGDGRRYGGKGVRKAIEDVRGEIASALAGKGALDHAEIDQLLIDLDGTPNKSRLGANAILGVSMAVVRAGAAAEKRPLYQFFPRAERRLPMPMFNVLNGGKHADSSLDFQEFMLVPVGAPSFAEAVRYASETFHALRDLLAAADQPIAVGDEGGFAPRLPTNELACEFIVRGIEAAGYRPGEDIAIALDPAATSFFDGEYALTRTRRGRKTAAEMIALYGDWVARYPIVSIEDGLAENDWDGFRAMTDFTVAMGGGQIKSGSLCRGERVAKYNRLLRIEKELGRDAIFTNPFAKRR
ncbi:phosphopyruvate hydratase [Rhodopila sp.]|jgi:enolase|uniref:phosphopyruvate hydratase n=1 Tax=Rhodopila sp. TaxID=2480087 RepID=UPI002B7ABD13|nr:phosphopyruvate hydratase [Rhodopila sp.]HVZ06900.1 phosphopyruvate hydratase [Rhodopila sp.]